jgi:hypothetical protein
MSRFVRFNKISPAYKGFINSVYWGDLLDHRAVRQEVVFHLCTCALLVSNESVPALTFFGTATLLDLTRQVCQTDSVGNRCLKWRSYKYSTSEAWRKASDSNRICRSQYSRTPVTLAEWAKAWTVFARWEAGIVGLNPTQGMDVWCLCAFFCACVVLCLGRGLATSWSPVQGVLPSVNDQETEKSALSSKVGAKRKGEKVLTNMHVNVHISSKFGIRDFRIWNSYIRKSWERSITFAFISIVFGEAGIAQSV